MSSNKRVLSGSQKRKNKVQRHEHCKKFKKISSFLNSPKCVSQKSRQYFETCGNMKESTSTFKQNIIRNEQIGNALFEQAVDRTVDVCEMGKTVESAEREKNHK